MRQETQASLSLSTGLRAAETEPGPISGTEGQMDRPAGGRTVKAPAMACTACFPKDLKNAARATHGQNKERSSGRDPPILFCMLQKKRVRGRGSGGGMEGCCG